MAVWQGSEGEIVHLTRANIARLANAPLLLVC